MNLDNPYILLTPGPLSTSPTVRQAMLRDWCTWDDDYNLGIVTPIREGLVKLATQIAPEQYTAVLMQGSGTFSVEAMIGSTVPRGGKLLVLANGEYGNRLGRIAITLGIETLIHDSGELAPPELAKLDAALAADPSIGHVVVAGHRCHDQKGCLTRTDGPTIHGALRRCFESHRLRTAQRLR